MASSLQPPTSVSTNKSTRRRDVTCVRPKSTATTIFHTFFLQICFLICTTILTLTSPTHAYPLRALDDSGDNNNTIVTEATGDVSNANTEDKYGKLILDVGQKTVISTSNWILGTLLIIVGLVQVFYGFKFIRMTLVLTGFISWAVVSMIVTVILNWELVYFLFKPSHYTFWIWFLAGCLGAIVCFRYWDLGVAFSGGFGGFALAMGIIAAVNDSHNVTNTARYILLAILILLGAAIATFYERFSIILGTSLGGAFLFMFGVDEFLQAGYREMIIIFDFAGKTLRYHPDRQVFIMIGCSLALACLGIAWEFWHHAKPLLMDRKALFRIYGRPFGKRPHKLAGQRLKKKVAQSDWYTYLTGCLCLRRRTAEEVLYEEYDEGYDGASAQASAHAHITTAVGAVGAAGAVAGSGTSTALPGQSGVKDEKSGSTSSESAMETVVIVVEETSEEYPTDSKPIAILPGTEVAYGSGIESSIHHVSQNSSSSSSSTLATQTAEGSEPVEVVITETSESVDENGARIVTTTTTTTTTTASGEERHEQHYSSQESRTHHSESTSFHHQSVSASNSNSSSSHAEMMMRTESSSTSSSSESTHRSATATRSIETSNTSTSRTLLQSMAAAHHSSSRTTTTTTTNSGSGSTTVVVSQSSSSSS